MSKSISVLTHYKRNEQFIALLDTQLSLGVSVYNHLVYIKLEILLLEDEDDHPDRFSHGRIKQRNTALLFHSSVRGSSVSSKLKYTILTVLTARFFMFHLCICFYFEGKKLHLVKYYHILSCSSVTFSSSVHSKNEKVALLSSLLVAFHVRALFVLSVTPAEMTYQLC